MKRQKAKFKVGQVVAFKEKEVIPPMEYGAIKDVRPFGSRNIEYFLPHSGWWLQSSLRPLTAKERGKP